MRETVVLLIDEYKSQNPNVNVVYVFQFRRIIERD
jgi:hypothetical protein